MERTRLGFSANSFCDLHAEDDEDANYLLRKCHHAIDSWEYFLSNDELLKKREVPLYAWFMVNMDNCIPCFFFEERFVVFALCLLCFGNGGLIESLKVRA